MNNLHSILDVMNRARLGLVDVEQLMLSHDLADTEAAKYRIAKRLAKQLNHTGLIGEDTHDKRNT